MAGPVDERRGGAVPPTVHQRRFIVAFAGLAVALTAAVSLAVWLAERGKPTPWTDHDAVTVNGRSRDIERIDDPVERAQAVATLVERRYVSDAGAPLATITAGEDVVSSSPGRDQVVAMFSSPTGVPVSFEYGNIVFFKMCGPAAGCSFDTRPAARPRRVVALVSRQAKELALRGLRYVHEADSAMIILPAGILDPQTPGGTPPTVVYYYRRADLERQLDDPLPDELDGVEPRPAQITNATAGTMFANYAPRLFRLNDPEPSADGAAVIYELVPLPTN